MEGGTALVKTAVCQPAC